MPTAPTPWATAITRHLATHGTATLDELVAACGHHIPPGRAHRQAEDERSRCVPDPTPRGPSDATVAIGRRSLIRRAANRLVRSGRARRLPDGRYQLTAGER